MNSLSLSISTVLLILVVHAAAFGIGDYCQCTNRFAIGGSKSMSTVSGSFQDQNGKLFCSCTVGTSNINGQTNVGSPCTCTSGVWRAQSTVNNDYGCICYNRDL